MSIKQKQGRSFGILILVFLYLPVTRIKIQKRLSEEFKKSVITRVQNGESQLDFMLGGIVTRSIGTEWFIRTPLFLNLLI